MSSLLIYCLTRFFCTFLTSSQFLGVYVRFIIFSYQVLVLETELLDVSLSLISFITEEAVLQYSLPVFIFCITMKSWFVNSFVTYAVCT